MSFHSWNRRNFITKVMGWAAATPLLGSSNFLFGQSKTTLPAPKAGESAKPIYRALGKTGISLPIVSMGVMSADIPGLLRRSYEVGMRHFDGSATATPTTATFWDGR